MVPGNPPFSLGQLGITESDGNLEPDFAHPHQSPAGKQRLLRRADVDADVASDLLLPWRRHSKLPERPERPARFTPDGGRIKNKNNGG